MPALETSLVLFSFMERSKRKEFFKMEIKDQEPDSPGEDGEAPSPCTQ